MGRATLFLLRKIAANSGRKEKVAGWRMARECGIVFTPSRRKPSPLVLRNCGLDYSFFPLNSLTESTVMLTQTLNECKTVNRRWKGCMCRDLLR